VIVCWGTRGFCQTLAGFLDQSGSKVRLGFGKRFSRPLRSCCGPDSACMPSSTRVCRVGCSELRPSTAGRSIDGLRGYARPRRRSTPADVPAGHLDYDLELTAVRQTPNPSTRGGAARRPSALPRMTREQSEPRYRLGCPVDSQELLLLVDVESRVEGKIYVAISENGERWPEHLAGRRALGS
jgi:hypothetical protein